jgi:hypothetical protein
MYSSKKNMIVICCGLLLYTGSRGQEPAIHREAKIFAGAAGQYDAVKIRFLATTYLLDAALNSINSISSLVKKENYRNKITSFNNPAAAHMGFSLEAEINLAIKPILGKTKSINTRKFSEIVASLIYDPVKKQLPGNIFNTGMVFNSLLSLVGNLAVNERKVSRQDVDSFVFAVSRYFTHYEKLREANISFDANIDKFNLKLQELQFDIREFMLDMVTVLYAGINRGELKQRSLEALLLQFLDKGILDTMFEKGPKIKGQTFHYPGDGIKTAKEIVYGIQKLFDEYQKIYARNYVEIRTVLLQTKELGKNINVKQVEQAVSEFDRLYMESKEADLLNLRLNTLAERLKYLVSTENMK